MNDIAPMLAAAVSLLGSVVVGLVAWGWRGEIATLGAEMGTHRAEMRASIAESVNSFYLQINGSYVKKELFNTLVGRVDGVEQRVNDAGD